MLIISILLYRKPMGLGSPRAAFSPGAPLQSFKESENCQHQHSVQPWCGVGYTQFLPYPGPGAAFLYSEWTHPAFILYYRDT